MHATFNGIRLRHVIYHKTNGTRETLHFVDHSQEIEDAMHIGARAIVTLSNSPIEGVIVHYSGNQDEGYEVTVETARRRGAHERS